MRERILVIEDDPSIRILLQEELEFEGFRLVCAEDGDMGFEAAHRENPDLIILDLMLPGMSGFEICRRLREEGSRVPVIVLSARSQETDKVRGLDLGADDYVTKPFGLGELVARVRAVLRRTSVMPAPDRSRLGDLTIDWRRREVFKGDGKLQLTVKEFNILKLLIDNPGEVISRDRFLDEAWPDVFVGERTVDTHIAALRKKIEDDPNEPRFILSVRGMGYRLNDQPVAGTQPPDSPGAE